MYAHLYIEKPVKGEVLCKWIKSVVLCCKLYSAVHGAGRTTAIGAQCGGTRTHAARTHACRRKLLLAHVVELLAEDPSSTSHAGHSSDRSDSLV